MVAAWTGDEDYRKAFRPPCGCEMLAEAERQTDPGLASLMRESARAAQETWRCPSIGYDVPDDPPDSADVRESLEAVRRVTGASGFTTCPNAYTRTELCARVVRAYRARKIGILKSIEPELSAALADGMLVLDDAINDRNAKSAERSRKNSEARTQQAATPSPPAGASLTWNPDVR